jgi:hypothetical protein
MLDELERLQGIIDAMIQPLADVTGLPTTYFQAAPTSQQQRQYGDRLIAAERYVFVNTTGTLSAKPVQLLAVDTTTGAFTVNLPASPSVGDRIVFWDAKANFGVSNLTIGRNGNNITNIADDYLMATGGAWVEFIWLGGSYGWGLRG